MTAPGAPADVARILGPAWEALGGGDPPAATGTAAGRRPPSLPFAPVELLALGPVEVRLHGAPADLGPPMQRAVLAVLLASADRVVSVDALVDRLWDGGPPERALGSLQAYVSNLRRALEPDRAPRTPPAVLLTRAPGYLLDTAGASVDLREFSRLTRSGADRLAADAPAEALADLDAALALWRGPAFADAGDAAWAQPERVRWEELRLAAAEDRAAALVALGRLAEAAADLAVHVRAAPVRERGWALLALALYRAGRQAESLDALRRARAVLADELGIDPGPELQRLEAAVLRQDPSLAAPPAVPAPDSRAGAPADAAGPTGVPPAPAGPAPAGPAAAERGPGAAAVPAPAPIPAPIPAPVPAPVPAPRGPVPTPREPLAGRREPLAVLRAAWERAAAGRGGVLLVDGEPGVGKTRLVEELAATCGAPVAWGRCPGHEVAPALWPWEQVLRAVPGGDALADRLTRTAGDEVVDVAAARIRLYDGLSAHLLASGPLLVVLDDLHWADPSSVRLLVHLAGQIAGQIAGQPASAPVLVVATFRRHEADQLVAALADLGRAGAQRLHLAGLAPGEVRELVAALTGSDPGEDAARALAQRTGGNAFFVREVASAGSGALPEHVRDVVLGRVARMPEAARRLLAVAAVGGADFDLPLVAAVAGVAEDDAYDLVDGAVAAGLVEEDPLRPSAFRFAHALVAEALLAGQTRSRRARTSRRFAEAMGFDVPDEKVGEAARHWLAAAGLDRPAARLAVRFASRAAELAARRLAPEEAAASWEEAVAAAELAGDVDPFDLLVGLARARHAAGEVPDALALLDRLLDAAGDDPARVAAAAVAVLGDTLWYPFPYGVRPQRLLDALVGAAADASPGTVDLALLLACLAVVHQHVGEPEVALPLAARAAGEARALGRPGVLSRVQQLRLLVLHGIDGMDETLPAVAEMLALPGLAPELAANARLARVSVLAYQARHAEAVAELDALGPALARIRSPLLSVQAAVVRASFLAFAGRLEESEAVYTDHLLGNVPHEGIAPTWLVHRFVLAWQRGGPGALAGELEQFGSGGQGHAWTNVLAMALADAGDRAGALRVLVPGAMPPRDYTWLGSAVARLQAAVVLGVPEVAAEMHAALAPMRGRLAVVGSATAVLGAVAQHLGEASAALGETARAAEELAEAVALLDRVGAPYWAARARLALAKCAPSGPAHPSGASG